VHDILSHLIRRTSYVRRIPWIKGLFSDTPLTEAILLSFCRIPFLIRSILGRAANLRLFYLTDQLLDSASRIIARDVFRRVSVGHTSRRLIRRRLIASFLKTSAG
jgi:hypothetical protein